MGQKVLRHLEKSHIKQYTSTLSQMKQTQLVNPNRTGLFLTCLGLGGGGGGGGCRLSSSLFVDLSQRNFVQGLTIKALAQIWRKICIKLMTS